MRRREFLDAVGGAAVAWPLAARAQPDPMRRIGVLMNTAADNPEGHAGVAAFRQVLQQLGWTDGRNVRIDTRWARTMSIATTNTRRNWSRSSRASSWAVAP